MITLRTIALIELAAWLAILLLILTQIIRPAINGTRLFPLFRRPRRERNKR